jgi:F420-non-reducing hydrogenase iron-sulfur subunit
MADETFNPKIVGFMCNWCSYAGADLCGVSRYQYPPNLRVARVMCSTRIPPHIVMRILAEGADGVMIGGCHLGDCHYISGNYFTEKRFDLMKTLLKVAGLEPGRIRLEWVSASEGEKFSKVVTDFTNQIKALGPTPVKTNPEIKRKLLAAEEASKNFRLTALTSKEYVLQTKGNVYGKKLEPEKLKAVIEKTADEEFERALILALTVDKSQSVKELSKTMNVPTDRVLDHIVELRKNNLIAMEHGHGLTPTYKAIIIGGE